MSTVTVQIVRPPQGYEYMIMFIKEVRALLGTGLKQSKDFVDGIGPLDVPDTMLASLIEIVHRHQARLTTESEPKVFAAVEVSSLIRILRDMVVDPNKDKSYILGYLDAMLAAKK